MAALDAALHNIEKKKRCRNSSVHVAPSTDEPAVYRVAGYTGENCPGSEQSVNKNGKAKK